MEPSNISTIDACFSALVNEDTPLALATVIQAVSPTTGNPGDKALVGAESIVEGWVGGGCVQHAVVKATRKALESGEPCVIRVGPKGKWKSSDGLVDFTSGCLSGGTLVVFIEPLCRRPTLSILGSSPVAHSLSFLAEHIGFRVTMASPDLDPAQLPESINFASDFSDINNDYLVIATQGKHDRAALTAALNSNALYITMIASAKKAAGLKAIMAKAGIGLSSLDRIHSPAGAEIGAVTPAEIALSVLSDVVRVRRGAQGKNHRHKPQENPQEVATAATLACCGE